MACTLLEGQIAWEGDRDKDGHRDYMVRWRVESDLDDGPANVMNTPGIAVPGNLWLIDADSDLLAYCTMELKARVDSNYKQGEPSKFWTLDQKFTTRPYKKCQDEQIDSPLDQPQEVEGTFIRGTEEGVMDRFGIDITNSAFERIRGKHNEWNSSILQVKVTQNVANLDLTTIYGVRDHVNDGVMWGFDPRCVLLTEIGWKRKYYGLCYVYYTREFTFEVKPETHDREVLDEATMALRGAWDHSSTSPTYRQYALAEDIKDDPEAHLNQMNFVKFKDWNGENAKTILNGYGRPWDPGTLFAPLCGTGTGPDVNRGYIQIEYYDEIDLLTLLGLPVSF
jgi:hypothetical protein